MSRAHPPKTATATSDPLAGEGRISLDMLLSLLHDDGWISVQQQQEMRVGPKAAKEDTRHPLTRIGEQGWLSATQPSFPLTLERLTKWFADKVKLPYVRIDPLKIDVEAVTKLVSQAYATRFRFFAD